MRADRPTDRSASVVPSPPRSGLTTEALASRLRILASRGAWSLASVLVGAIALDRPAAHAQVPLQAPSLAAHEGERTPPVVALPPASPVEGRVLGLSHRAVRLGLDGAGGLALGLQFGPNEATLEAPGLGDGSRWRLQTPGGPIEGVVVGCGSEARLRLLSSDGETPFAELAAEGARYVLRVGTYVLSNPTPRVGAVNELAFRSETPGGPAFGLLIHANHSGYSVRWLSTAGVDPQTLAALQASVAFMGPLMLLSPPPPVEGEAARLHIGPLIELLRAKAGMPAPHACTP